MIELFGWTGNAGFILGAILLAKKIRFGWYCQVLGNLSYLIFSVLMKEGGISLGVLSILLIILDIYGLLQWKDKSWIKLK